MGGMAGVPPGTATAKKKERFELCLELYGRNIKDGMDQTSNAGVKTLTEHGELMLQTAFDDLAEWCCKLIGCWRTLPALALAPGAGKVHGPPHPVAQTPMGDAIGRLTTRGRDQASHPRCARSTGSC